MVLIKTKNIILEKIYLLGSMYNYRLKKECQYWGTLL